MNPGGYGTTFYRGRSRLAHRVAYCEYNGVSWEQIKGLIVRHDCDNRACIEPSHLRLGTQADNVQDMIGRGRQRYSPIPALSGATHPAAKLDYAKVREIRAGHRNGAKQRALARAFGVSQSVISEIVNNTIWDEAIAQVNEAIFPLTITAKGLSSLGFDPTGKPYTAIELDLIIRSLIGALDTALVNGIAEKAA